MLTELKGKTILIVDDDPASLFLFSEILKPSKAIIICANDGATTHNILNTQHTDLILLDLKLPDTTGFQLLNEIRKRFTSIKVIAQTAFPSEIISECLKAGFDDCINKPVNAVELFNKIYKLLYN